ncbi:MAG: 16S rRNA (guanine(527)-N(7))-methyltransferase RsmG [Gammaproteobacteria bacterium]|nr:16S rRNA (guanine(527)-N(7))-methyltransferase RsmG [Gammaproteobacteria bacterium]|tara:strand:+ start:85 stop:675 length:591 start_codon:yes stop_codon:yes gene_type:complete
MHNPFKEEEKNKINIFINLALEFNKTHNIFSRKEHDEVYKKDILDCEPLIKRIKNNTKILDLGSGGGFPGILLAITKPKSQISLIESSSKKCFFLRSVADKLALKNTTIINKKIEPNNNIGVFDIITARAFASIDKITKLTKTNRNKDTEYLLLKGKNKTIQEELTDIDKNLYLYEIIKLDTKTHERNMVLIKNNE